MREIIDSYSEYEKRTTLKNDFFRFIQAMRKKNVRIEDFNNTKGSNGFIDLILDTMTELELDQFKALINQVYLRKQILVLEAIQSSIFKEIQELRCV